MRIGIVDDNSFLISSTKEKLSIFEDLEISFSALNGEEAINMIKDQLPLDIILMDIEMPVMDGIQATNRIKHLYPQIKIVILTVFDNDENIFNAIKAGADGYLLKDVNPRDMYQGLIDTMEGGAAMSPSIAKKTLNLLRNPDELILKQSSDEITLSNREIEVLEQLSKGLKNKQVANNLFISPGTVKKHVDHIYSKLHAHNRVELMIKARNHGFI
jgi:DNA-binding NarL/FixJ family response regulator